MVELSLVTAKLNRLFSSRKIAIKESKFADFGIAILPEEAYPLDCPFPLEKILDEDFYGL